jgi:hypothetical protein
MSALFASGQIINLILALTLAEALIVAVYHRRTGRGPMLGPFLANLLAGVWLLLAVRCALAGAWLGRILPAGVASGAPGRAAPELGMSPALCKVD